MHAAEFVARLVTVIGVDLLLSGDNAVVIALVCRDLPERQRGFGVALGTCGAVLARIVLALGAAWLISVPGLRLVGGALLLWIAVKMLRDEESDERGSETTLWRAVLVVTLADVSMSLDNVVALAALARGSWALMIVGVLLSVPLVVVGARLVSLVVDRAPALVWAGAALLGWVAGGVVAADPWIAPYVDSYARALEISGAAAVLAAGLALRARSRRERGE